MNIALIPVRGGSKSIPKKNTKLIAGKPLVYWSIKAACDCKDVDKVYICTDCDEIRAVVSGFRFFNVEIVDRSMESASDTASTEICMMEFAQQHDFDSIALVQATSPLITSDDLINGYSEYFKNGVDSVLSVVEQKRFIWRSNTDGYAESLNYDYRNRPRRQDFTGQLVENGAFYITSRESLLKSQCRISGKIKTVIMPSESYIELDEPEDWTIVETLLKKREFSIAIPEIKMFLTDCDGTLTDAGMYYSPEGDSIKKFNTRDGVGLRLLKEQGIITGIITSEVSEAVNKRAEKLNVDELLMGVSNKLEAIENLCAKYDIEKGSVAYIGDDLNDIDAISCVGFGICVNDAVEEVKNIADWITVLRGGVGAVREAADAILKAL